MSSTKQEPGSIIPELKRRAEERRNRYELKVIAARPSPIGIEEATFIGDYSFTFTETKRRWIWHALQLRGVDIPQTPPEVARDYLYTVIEKPLRATASQVEHFKQHRSHPLYADPGYMPEAVYVDLQSAYWTLVQVYGWDADYYPDKWIGQGRDMSDFPLPDHKLARNTLVSAGISNHTYLWKSGRIIEKPSGSKLRNLGLWALVQDTLHWIAATAVYHHGAKYVHTDGYIMEPREAEAFIDWLGDFGLPARVKQGPTDARIYAAGHYTIGSHVAPDFMKRSLRSFSNIKWEMLDDTLIKRSIGKLRSKRRLNYACSHQWNDVIIRLNRIETKE